jgi:hypothetical protein
VESGFNPLKTRKRPVKTGFGPLKTRKCPVQTGFAKVCRVKRRHLPRDESEPVPVTQPGRSVHRWYAFQTE